MHAPDHPVVGTPLCAACYDYTGAVLWHAHLGELWRRTRIGIDRALAPLASEAVGHTIPATRLRDHVKVAYVKVAEFQKRGVVHLHVVVRLDGVDGADSSAVVPPPAWASAGMLRAAIDQAVRSASVAMPSPDGVMRTAEWGSQYDVSEISDGARTAAYLAKYATKTASDSIGSGPVLARRIRRLRRGWLRRTVGAHVARMVETAWELGGRGDLAYLKLRRWAHMLGFRGHFSTKSRAYSVTLGALRAVRRQWRARQNSVSGQPDVWHAQNDESTEVVGQWRYAGRGYVGSADALLVEAMAREYEETKIEYREQIAREKQLAAEIF
ncbi:hypothetical protein F4561_005076 [Lipingzhangella halophila]|uniref:Replication initiation protein n=1 Tax=Lipingzhangella halophila TaxID=1783352 RepID=A0A7W7RMN4_9ACTN|nr:hypothetical protein [Lipingzhangella halophila]